MWGRKKKPDTSNVYEPIPAAWLKDAISFKALSESYRQTYGVDIKDHDENQPRINPSIDSSWNSIIELLLSSDEIRNFDSGFCSGVALIRSGEIIADIVFVHYSRARA